MKWLAAFLVMCLSFLCAWIALDTGFISDDFVLIEAAQNTPMTHLFTSNWLGETNQGGFYRPISLLSFKIDRVLHGTNPRGYHWTNLWMHVVISLFVFLLISRLQQNTVIALCAASLFAVHPVHQETIAWVSGRTDLLSAFFYLLCLNLFLSIDPSESRGCLSALLALAAGGCAMLSKEMGFTIPVMIIAVDRLDRPRNGWWQRYRSQHYLSYFVLAAGVLLLRFIAVGQFLGGYGSQHLQFHKILMYISIYFDFMMEPFQLRSGNNTMVHILFTVCLVILSVIALFDIKTRMAAVFWWISLAPVLTLCRTQYLYLPSVGMVWMVGVIICNGTREERTAVGDFARIVLGVTLTGMLLAASVQKQADWNHSGWVAVGVRNAIRAMHPALPGDSRLVLLNPPQNNRLKMGVFQNGFAEAVRLWYGDESLDGIRVRHPETYRNQHRSGDIVIDCQGALIRDVTDRWQPRPESTVSLADRALLKLNQANPMTSITYGESGPDISGIELHSKLSHAADLGQGTPVAEIELIFSDDRVKTLLIQAGVHTSEWAIDRADLQQSCQHNRAPVIASEITGTAPEPPILNHLYRGKWQFNETNQLKRLNIRFLLGKDSGSASRTELDIRDIRNLWGAHDD